MACEETNRCRDYCHRSSTGHGSAAGRDANTSTDLGSNTSTSPSKSELFRGLLQHLGVIEDCLSSKGQQRPLLPFAALCCVIE